MSLREIKDYLIGRAINDSSLNISKDIANYNSDVLLEELQGFFTIKAILSFNCDYLYESFKELGLVGATMCPDERFLALSNSVRQSPLCMISHALKSNEEMSLMLPNQSILPAEKIASYEIGLFHVVSEGRNAWHTTWVEKIDTAQFFISNRAAQGYCEEKRIQGTVFTIHEVPALAVNGDKGTTIMFAEIGSNMPFSQHLNLLEKFKIKNGNSNISGAPITTPSLYMVYRSIEIELGIYKGVGARKFIGLSPKKKFEKLPTDMDSPDSSDGSEFLDYISRSIGVDHYLEWGAEVGNDISLEYLRKLILLSYY